MNLVSFEPNRHLVEPWLWAVSLIGLGFLMGAIV